MEEGAYQWSEHKDIWKKIRLKEPTEEATHYYFHIPTGQKTFIRPTSDEFPAAAAPPAGAVAAPSATKIKRVKTVAPTPLPEAAASAPSRRRAAPATIEAGKAIDEMKQWYFDRKKGTQNYVYTADGNLLRKATEEKPKLEIPLRGFRSLTAEEFDELEAQRREAMTASEARYEEALENLRNIFLAYRNGEEGATERAVVIANQAVIEAEQLRNQAAYPIRYIHKDKKLEIREVLLDQEHEQRKMQEPTFSLRRRDLPEASLGVYLGFGERVEERRMEGGSLEVEMITADWLSPEATLPPPNAGAAPAEFVFAKTKYLFPLQAYEAEKAKQAGQEELFQQYLRTRSLQTIRSLVQKHPLPDTPEAETLWSQILKNFYKTDSTILEKFLNTQGKPIYHENPLFVRAIERARAELLEEASGSDDADGNKEKADRHVITEAEQKKARTGAVLRALHRTGH